MTFKIKTQFPSQRTLKFKLYWSQRRDLQASQQINHIKTLKRSIILIQYHYIILHNEYFYFDILLLFCTLMHDFLLKQSISTRRYCNFTQVQDVSSSSTSDIFPPPNVSKKYKHWFKSFSHWLTERKYK